MGDIASVEQRLHGLLEQIFEPPVNKVSDWDGYYFSFGSAGILVTVLQTEDGLPVVKVASPILNDAQKTPELLDALNDMNGGMDFGRAYWMNGFVWAGTNLVGETLDREELEQAMTDVGKWADGVDEAFAQAFGATTPNAPAPEPPPAPAWAPRSSF